MSEETTQTTVSEQVESNNTPTTPTSEPAPTTEEQSINSMGERPEWLPEKFKSAQDMAESYSQLEGKISQKEEDIRSTIMQELEADAYKDRPPTKGEYILPEGIDDELAKSNELLEWWADQAFENGYSQEEFAEGIEMYKKVANIGMTDPQKEMQQLGDNGKERVQAVEMWSNKFFPAEQHAEIANLCATAEGVKAMETVMNALKGSSVLGNAEVVSDLSEENLRTMMADERYWNVAKRDPAFVAQVDDGFKKLYR
tara:strand:- start:2294 stop:3061 length:768 start_codon:yes stop_codon:yes gene_type:complete